MPTLAANGIELHYEREGEGPALLALAGMASDSASWGPLVAPLAARFDLIRPDNRCTGRTRPMPCPTGREEMLGDCRALLDHLKLDRVHLLGHSMGGMLALHLALAEPGRVASVIVMGTAGRAGGRARQLFADLAMLQAMPELDPKLVFRLLFPWLFAPAFFETPGAADAAAEAALAYPHRQPPEGFRAQTAMMGDFAEPPDIAAIRAPLLAIAGAEDLLAPPDLVAAAVAHRPDTALATIPDAGHSIHWDAPEAVAAAILGFHAAPEGPVAGRI